MPAILIQPSIERRTNVPPGTRPGARGHRRSLPFVLGCSVLAFFLLGYHPAAEDGGIYAAATVLRLHGGLFPAERGFAAAQSGRSVFVPLLAGWARLLHLPLDGVLLLTFALAMAATVAAGHTLAQQMFADVRQQRGAVLLFAISLGLPVAGTSLYLVDPYLTARSISTPLLLLSLTWLLQRRYVRVGLCLAAAAAIHPIMTVCALPLLLTLCALRSAKPRRSLLAVAFGVAVTMVLLRYTGPVELPAARAVSLTRLYWFPARWASYEWLGVIAPTALLLVLQRQRNGLSAHARHLAAATAVSTALVAACTALLVREGTRSLLLARLQPLRLLHPVYCVFLLLLGGWLAGRRGRHTRLLYWTAIVTAAASLVWMQQSLYGSSGHLELPGRPSPNGYVQAFRWAGTHTPPDALFALDADYTRAPGEDAQLFRAVAGRSALPDAAKDGGVASVVPALAAEWLQASEAQRGLADMPDAERVRRVRPLHATWLMLPAASRTAFDCPYRNATAQVCRLP